MNAINTLTGLDLMADFTDPLQFACRKDRGVDDAILYVLDQTDSLEVLLTLFCLTDTSF